MIIVFFFTLAELLMFSFFSPITELAQYVFVLLNLTILSIFILKNHFQYSQILFIGLALRLILLVIDTNKIFPILHSGADTEVFHAHSLSNSINGNYDLHLTYYEYFITFIYNIIGSSRIVVQYINVLLGMGILFVLISIFDELSFNIKQKKHFLCIAAFFPHLIIFSSILLREAWCEFFIISSLLYFIRWMKHGGSLFIIQSFICVLVASVMHSGCIFVGIGYLIAVSFYHPRLSINKISPSAIFFTIILGIVSFYLLAITEIFTTHFNNFDEEKFNGSGLYVAIEGESAYLTWMNPNSISQMLIFAPLKMFYFLFSPLPFNWRGFQDTFAFFFDSCFYFYCMFVFFKNHKYIKDKIKKNIVIYLMVSFLFLTFSFGYGTITAGTAMRHRCKIVPIILVIYAITISEKKKSLKNKVFTIRSS